MVAITRIIRMSKAGEPVESSEVNAKRIFFKFTSSGDYKTAVVDIGKSMTSYVYAKVEKSTPNSSTALIYARVSQDNITWSDWTELFEGAAFAFRYIQFKVAFEADSIFELPSITFWTDIIDVPDIVKAGQQTVEIGGSTINYGYSFFIIPYVVCSAIGAGYKAEITAKTKTDFTVRVLDSSNTDVGGVVDWHAKGY